MAFPSGLCVQSMVYDGGTRIEADAPLDTIPLFLKEDARLSLQMKPSTAETMHRR